MIFRTSNVIDIVKNYLKTEAKLSGLETESLFTDPVCEYLRTVDVDILLIPYFLMELNKQLQLQQPNLPADEWIDNSFCKIIKHGIENVMFLNTFKDINLTRTLSVTLVTNWNKSINLLIDLTENMDVGLPLVSSPFKDYTPLMVAIAQQNNTAIGPILEKTKSINTMTPKGETALSLAVINATEKDDYFAFDELMIRKDLLLIGGYMDWSIFELVRLEKYANLFEKLIQKIQTNFNPELFFVTPLYYPIPFLQKNQQDELEIRLLKQIETMEIFQNNLQLKNDFMHFLKNDTKLPFKKLNRLAIVFEIVCYLLHPEWIKQGNSNLCGPASVMQNLAINQPEKFIRSCMEIAELGSNKQPKILPQLFKTIPSTTRETAYLLLFLWMETVRHNYNLLTGYSFDSKFEMMQGMTSPYQLEKIFADFGCNIVTENMQVTISTHNVPGKVFELFRRHVLADYITLPEPFKIYGKKHIEQQNDQFRFDTFLNWFEKNKDDTVTVLLTAPFATTLIWSESLQSQTGYLLPPTHYANIKNFRYDPVDNSVTFNMLTFGKDCNIEKLDANKFKKGFQGAVFIQPELIYSLSAKP